MYWDTPKETIEFFKEYAKYDGHYFEVKEKPSNVINFNEYKEKKENK